MYNLPIKKIRALKIVTFVMIVFALISTWFASINIVYIRTYVNGNSMYPTLNASFEQTGKNDVVYINRFAKAQVDDIVVLDLRNHSNFGNYAIKRLIATEGSVVNITLDAVNMQCNLIVDGKCVTSKSYQEGFNAYNNLQQYITNHEQDTSRVIKNQSNEIVGVMVKNNEIFALGDNWETSKDSTLVGPFNINTIVGRVDIVVSPSENEFLCILKRIF